MVINIPADVTELAADTGAVNSTALPKGAQQVRTDFGVAGWGGACPPQGDKLEVPAEATAALAGYMIHANTLGKASFTAKYGRAK